MKKLLSVILSLVLCLSLAACGESKPNTETAAPAPVENASAPAAEYLEATEVQVFIAASLENAFIEIINMYQAVQPNVTITYNADSSGKLLTQIEEGANADIFFSAGASQVNTLDEKDGLMLPGTKVDLLKNQVALITYKGSGTAVTGLDNLADAKSIALADGSVPVGKYTRTALVKAGLLPETDDIAGIETVAISSALGGVEINECGNVSKVKEAVKEGSNEVGTVYYSDAYSVRDDVEIIEMIPSELTGDILYPMCRVQNKEANAAQTNAADDFFTFIQSDECLKVFEKYMFIINK